MSAFLRLLSVSKAAVAWVLRITPGRNPHAAEARIRVRPTRAPLDGELEQVEQPVVGKVFTVADRRVGSVMTPRLHVDWVDLHSEREELVAKLTRQRRRHRLLVCDGALDHVVGIVHVEDLLADCVQGKPLDLYDTARQPVFVSETATTLALLECFRATQTHTALVLDECDRVQGIVTLTDILEGVLRASASR